MNEPVLKLFINGEFVDAENGETFESYNPANGTVVARCAWAGPRDADKAVNAAAAALESGEWPQMSAAERKGLILRLADLLKERLEDFAVMECRDAGALIGKARSDVALGVSQLKYFADMALKYDGEPRPVEGMQRPGRSFTYTVREPIGVCAQIIPWNFPITMAIWKLGPALATGNTLVLKCAPETPVSALNLAHLCKEAGFPKGVINIITGDAEVGEALINNPKVQKVAFTGSTEVGRKIMNAASRDMKRVTLECGGKSANIVLDDADPSIAIDGSLYATFFHSGQVCESGTRLLLGKSRHDEFVERMVERVRRMRIGDPMDPETTIGPVVSKQQMERVLGYIDIGRSEGARVAVGGRRADGNGLSNGFFVEPTIFTDVTNDMRIAREEIFGPVLSILKYDNVDEAVRIANDSDYGLAAGVWSADDEKARKVAMRLRAGWVWVNEWHVLAVSAPFGGYKQSGVGREFGEEGLNAYTEVKTIYQDDSKSRDKKFWYDVVVPRVS
ncbi:MAG: aldehyde dehydrogenase family protein [Rhizobiaceae bacterium]|nr:aldehyde dehydrogenase family protein [Rhizobiaceae bacterium]